MFHTYKICRQLALWRAWVTCQNLTYAIPIFEHFSSRNTQELPRNAVRVGPPNCYYLRSCCKLAIVALWHRRNLRKAISTRTTWRTLKATMLMTIELSRCPAPISVNRRVSGPLTKIPLATLWLVTFVKILSISEKDWLLIRVGISTSGYKPIEYIVSKKD